MYYKLQNNLFPFSFLFNIQHSFLRKKFHAIQVYKFLLKISIKKRKKSNFINLPRREDCIRHLYKINIFIRSEKKIPLKLQFDTYNLLHYEKNLFSFCSYKITRIPTSISNIPMHVNNLR